MFKTITVVYWRTRKHSEALGIEDKSIYDYSDEKLNKLILHILTNGFNVMIRRSTNPVNLIVWVDIGGFKQM